MIADVSALAYLEARQIRNRIRETLRHPGRMLIYVAAIAYFIFVIVIRARNRGGLPITTIPEPYASTLFFAYISLVGIMMYGAASGIVGAFSSAADARFLNGSAISQRIVVVWLQLRRSGTSIVRMILTILLYTIVFSGSGTFAGIALATLGGTLVATATAIPMLKLRQVAGIRSAQSLAGAVAAFGILPMTILLTSIPPSAPTAAWAHGIERFGAGYAFNALFGGHGAALLALYVFGFGVVTLSYLTGNALYPDLYAASLRVLEFRERQRRSAAAGFSIEHRYEQRSARLHGFFDMLAGPWTIVWKEWIAFVRSPSMQRVFFFGILASAAVGVFFGQVVSGSRNQLSEILSLGSMAANMIVIFVAMGSAIGLSSDISKPLWWMGRDPLFAKLSAWTVGTSWRLAIVLGVGVGAWAAFLHNGIIAAAGIPAAFTMVMQLRGVGLVLYSLFPSTIDQRGPLALVRALLTYLFSFPPAAAAFIVLWLQRSIIEAVIVYVAFSLAETALLVAFASWRIAGQGVAVARAESF